MAVRKHYLDYPIEKDPNVSNRKQSPMLNVYIFVYEDPNGRRVYGDASSISSICKLFKVSHVSVKKKFAEFGFYQYNRLQIFHGIRLHRNSLKLKSILANKLPKEAYHIQ